MTLNSRIQQRRLLALGSDLFFMPQIEAAAKEAALAFEWLDQPLNDPEFLAKLAAQPTALIVLDLNTSLPWPHWLPAAKADPASAAVPWLAFGSHMNPRRLAAARHAGAERAVPKSQFADALREMVAEIKA
jgi:hypothetical protein